MSEQYTVIRNADVPMRDGVRLRTDLWLPQGGAPAAAILFRTPYDKRMLNMEFLRPQQCVEAGFAALVQDTRGRFASEGEWRAIMWQQEALDTFDSVEWIATQPWSSGAVGMAGVSYLAIVQLAGAAEKPPHLKAIAPAMAGVLRHERAETGGAMRLEHVLSWVAFMAGDWLQKRIAKGEPVAPEHMGLVLAALHDPRILMDHRPLRDIPLFKLPGFPVTFDSLVAALDEGPELDLSGLGIATLHCGGWYDIYSRSTVGMFKEDITAGSTVSHLVMGCWGHHPALHCVQGQVNFGALAMGSAARIADQHLAFFRRYLRQEPVPVPRVKYFLMGANVWRESDSWPPPGLAKKRLFLHGADQAYGNRLLDSAPRAPQEVDRYVYDPADPTPSIGGRVLFLGRLTPGPVDQRPLAGRSDVLRYTSAPLAQALDLVGSASVQLHVSSSAPDTDFIARLIDVAPNGVALPVTEGALRMRWRNGFAQPEPLVDGQIERISIAMADVAWRFEPGHCLRLQLQSASYPHLDPNMGTGHDIGADSAGVAATNCVYHDERRPSWIELDLAAPPGPA